VAVSSVGWFVRRTEINQMAKTMPWAKIKEGYGDLSPQM